MRRKQRPSCAGLRGRRGAPPNSPFKATPNPTNNDITARWTGAAGGFSWERADRVGRALRGAEASGGAGRGGPAGRGRTGEDPGRSLPPFPPSLARRRAHVIRLVLSPGPGGIRDEEELKMQI